ncbi:MAG: NAD(P)H-hydrate dehydratase [Anaerolineae bacterium]|nr:NAD(P)H-hydrate dehydratase [Anaerolineae bacterium]
MKLVNVEEMRRIEQATDASGHSYAAMMDMAGQSVARVALALRLVQPDENVLILVGPGNNGGDGLVAARALREAGCDVTLYIWKRDVKGDENFRQLKRKRRGLAILWADNDSDFSKLREELGRAELVIDALLGTGIERPIQGRLAELMQVVKNEIIARRQVSPAEAEDLNAIFGIPRFPVMEAQILGMPLPKMPRSPYDDADFDQEEEDEDDFESDEDWEPDEDEYDDEWAEEGEMPPPPWPPLPVLAVDCPSGLNCDTGALDPATIPADVTVTFAFPKWGQLQYPGAGACGLLSVAPIGVPPQLAQDIQVELVEHNYIRRWLPGRPADAHKGTFGRVLIVAGSTWYPGAALLSGQAAARAGAGLVTLAVPSALQPALIAASPETTWLPLPGAEGTHTAAGVPTLLDCLPTYDALLVGPGFSTAEAARAFIEALLSSGGMATDRWAGRVVFDADALNILATLPDWPGRLPPGSILTPHPGEMGRLIGATAAEVNGRRIETARRWAAQWGHIVVLKGPHTVIAAPDGRTGVLPFAVPTLATAGSGDVLAGAIVAMLGQGLAAFEAAIVGAYLHAYTGVVLGREIGMSGVIAGDLVRELPHALRNLYVGS